MKIHFQDLIILENMSIDMRTTKQGNLFDPRDTAHNNLQFLLCKAPVIQGVHGNGPWLRAMVTAAGDDQRHSAKEASPAISSVDLDHH